MDGRWRDLVVSYEPTTTGTIRPNPLMFMVAAGANRMRYAIQTPNADMIPLLVVITIQGR
jgi:hypothetical protein